MYQHGINESRRYSHGESTGANHILNCFLKLAHQNIVTPVLRFFSFIKNFSKHPRAGRKSARTWVASNLVTVHNILIVLWLWLLYWGEYSVHEQSIKACDWDAWERWPQHIVPHRLLLVADPQLVDPHTYPGRPWPLSTITIKQTDVYLRRAYSRLQRNLRPETTIFLGDLFDGGREWSTPTSHSKDETWMSYGDKFWDKEFERFTSIFFRPWRADGVNTSIIASLPGNHDLGFGKDIQLPVRNRFQAYFGEGNRVDIIGNHTFVSIDAPSLSAKDEGDPEQTVAIWKPTEDFLDTAQSSISDAIARRLGLDSTPIPNAGYEHIVADLNTKDPIKPPDNRSLIAFDTFPIILLSHVPLHRPPGAPCGPLRERDPPTPPPPGDTNPVNPDDPNSIRDWRGDQYKNLLTRSVSSQIAEKLGGAIEFAFSGDDHDYCELTHSDYPSSVMGIKEITVKSISWAMGRRKPGVLLVSMSNPISSAGKPIVGPVLNAVTLELDDDSRPDHSTLQSHLCLLPDQLAIFIQYAIFAGISLAVLAVRAVVVTLYSKAIDTTGENGDSLLPSFVRQSLNASTELGARYNTSFPMRGARRRASSLDNWTPPSRSRINAEQDIEANPSTSFSSHGGIKFSLMESSKSTDDLAMYSKNDKAHWWDGSKAGRIGPPLLRKLKEDASFSRLTGEWIWSVWKTARVVMAWFAYLQFR